LTFTENSFLIDAVALLISSIFLAIASICDLRKREVPDKLWIIFGSVGLIITGLRLYGGYTSPLLLTISILVSLAIGFVMSYVGIFGGADGKAIICLSLAVPLVPAGNRFVVVWFLSPFFPLIVLTLGYLLSFLVSLSFLARNLLAYLREGSSMFDGLHDESFVRKLFAIVSGYRLDREKLITKPFVYPMERVVTDEEGRKRRRFDLSLGIGDDDHDRFVNEFLNSLGAVGGPRLVWATPGLPMMVFFLGALVFLIAVNL
jgi:archaeal preflagellin peptidase FlaK